MNIHLIKLIAITLLSMVLTIVSSFVLARLLSVEDRGLHQLFVTAVSYAVTFATAGSGFALALSMRKKQYRHWKSYFLLFLIFAVIIAILGLLLFDFTDYPQLFIINVLFTALLTMTLEKVKIDPQLKVYRILTLQQPILLVTVYGVAYLLLNEQPLKIALYLLSLYSLLQAVSCLFYLYKTEKSFLAKNPDVEKINNKFFFSTWFKQNILQIFGATASSIDKFLIVFLLGNYSLGLYTVCIAFDSLVTKFVNMLADYYYAGLLNHLNRLKAVLAVILLMSVAAVLLVPLLAETVIGFFFSQKYVEVSSVLIWFILNAILAGLAWVFSQPLLMQGKQVLLFIPQTLSILVFILLFYLLKEQQLYGVAYAFLVGNTVKLLISLFYYFKYPIIEQGAV
ncbi:MAG: hypothetical protein Q4B95_00830 [Lonepinella koalarum]|nr:hypothetical protein [Lonepinella koalarum]